MSVKSKLWLWSLVSLSLSLGNSSRAEDAPDAQKLLEDQIKRLEKTDPAMAAKLREAMKKQSNPGSSSSKPTNGGSGASASAKASATGSGGEGTTSTEEITNENGKIKAKSTVNGIVYELTGSADDLDNLEIKVTVNNKTTSYLGMKKLPAQHKEVIDKLMKRIKDGVEAIKK